MASFVTEVLSSAGKLETQEVQGKLEALTKKIHNLKLQIHEHVHSKFLDFQPTSTNAEDLSKNVDTISQEMQELSDKIENEIKSLLNMSTGVVHSLKDQLMEVNDVMSVLACLVKIQDGLESIASANKSQNFSEAAEAILLIHSLLTDQLAVNKDIKILTALQTEFCIQKEKFMMDIGQKWEELLFWDVQNDSESKQRKCELTIRASEDNHKKFKSIVEALEKLDMLDMKLKNFGNKLMENFIQACITSSNATVSNSSTSDSKTLCIVVYEGAKDSKSCRPEEVFLKLITVLQVLDESCLHVTVETLDNKGQVGRETLMERLGGIVSRQVLDMVVKQCLTPSIPTSNKHLKGFHDVVKKTNHFHEELTQMKFIAAADSTLPDFVQNVNVLFANKKCQEILEKARRLMTSDIHDIVQVTGDKPLGDLPSLGQEGPSSKKAKKLELAGECRLDDNTFRLPTCHISGSVQQLLLLAYETLQEATASSAQCAIQMFYAVRNMFELFCSVFPTYHKRSLASFPQLSAIFHNNCMFVAHHLLTLGHQFREKLPSSINTTFVDLVPKIRHLGTEIFLQQLSKQKTLIREYLQGAKGFESVADKELSFAAERAIKQIMYQFQHLEKVWREVLPPTTYRKAIGTLLNSAIVDITGSIVALEDISSDDAKQMASLLTIILEKAGGLLKTSDSEDVNIALQLQRNVPKWLRFQELITVLNASLLEISDRWAEGKGPLAVEFSPTEMKQLIRALFQNTERRANVLAKIK